MSGALARVWLVARAAALCSLASACAAAREDPPPAGDACDSGADCAPVERGTGGCGFVRLCIAGRCEQLDDAGTPRSRTVSCALDGRP